MIEKLKVKRKHVLDAIRFNNLVAGSWYTSNGYGYKPNCSACLVGSTVRRAVIAQEDIGKDDFYANDAAAFINQHTMMDPVGNDLATAEEALKYEQQVQNGSGILTALSRRFEQMVRTQAAAKYGVLVGDLSDKQIMRTRLTATQKRQLTKWVKDHIPEEFEVSY